MTEQAVSGSKLIIAKIGEHEVTLVDLFRDLVLLQQWETVEKCVEHELILSVLQERQIGVTQEEIREYLTVFRQHHKLLTGEDMHRYLPSNHMTDAHFLEKCTFDTSLQKLKEVLFKDQIDQYFAYRQLQLATVETYKIVLNNEEAAKEIVASLRDGSSFFDLAHRYSQDEATKKVCGYSGSVAVSTLDPKMQELLASAAEGTVVGPLKVAKEYHIVLVHKVSTATFDGETRNVLLDELFDQWLTECKERGGIQLLV